MRRASLLAAALALCSCNVESKPDGAMQATGDRFGVTHVGTFQAATEDRASRRSMYVIHDSVTGVDYLAVEGCGTAQLVTVHHDKTTTLEEQ